MEYVLAVAILLHGLIHLMGFAKAFNLGKTTITREIPKSMGIQWLFVAGLLVVTSVFLFVNSNEWWIPALFGTLLSQALIFTMWHDAKYGTILNMVILLAVVNAIQA